MTTKEKLIFAKEHGISISYIASQVNMVPATLTKWMRNEKGMLKKNEAMIESALLKLAKEIWLNMGGDFNDRNL